MTPRIDADAIRSLVDARLLSMRSVIHPDTSLVDPVSIKDGSWVQKKRSRILACLAGTTIEASYDRAYIGTDNRMLERMVAEISGEPAPEPTPTENDLIIYGLATAVTEAWPDLSNHVRLAVLKHLGETP